MSYQVTTLSARRPQIARAGIIHHPFHRRQPRRPSYGPSIVRLVGDLSSPALSVDLVSTSAYARRVWNIYAVPVPALTATYSCCAWSHLRYSDAHYLFVRWRPLYVVILSWAPGAAAFSTFAALWTRLALACPLSRVLGCLCLFVQARSGSGETLFYIYAPLKHSPCVRPPLPTLYLPIPC